MDANPPIPLSGEARTFWNKHFKPLSDRGILTDADLESFTVLCLTWSKIVALSDVQPGPEAYREMIQFANVTKQYQALARQFGLLPRERKQAKMDAPPKEAKDEFGF